MIRFHPGMAEEGPRRGRAEAAREASRVAMERRRNWTPERQAEAAARKRETERTNEEARRALLARLSPQPAAKPSGQAPNESPRPAVGRDQLTERQRRVYESQKSRGISSADAMLVAKRSAP